MALKYKNNNLLKLLSDNFKNYENLNCFKHEGEQIELASSRIPENYILVYHETSKEQATKENLSKLLKGIKDKSIQAILREVLFNEKTILDFEKVQEIIDKHPLEKHSQKIHPMNDIDLEWVFSENHRHHNVIFWDKKEGRYYNRETDLYLYHEEGKLFGL